jgi:hypothetical protein
LKDDGEELANYVSSITNGQYKVEDTGWGDVSLYKKDANGDWEMVGEENDVTKEDLFNTYLSSYL